MDDSIDSLLNGMIGKRLCRIDAASNLSLSFGFGERVYHGKKYLKTEYYGEWELGTYRACWRVTNRGNLICGVRDNDISSDALNKTLLKLLSETFLSLKQVSPLDLCVELSNGYAIEFLATSSDDDELFHIFGPEKLFIRFSLASGWGIGRSDKPRKDQ